MKILVTALLLFPIFGIAQETLQTVTDRGNVTTHSLQIGGNSVNANSTKLFINNPLGKNFAISAGANMITEQGLHFYNWSDNPAFPYLSLNNSGNFGIGIAAPKAKLDVSGNILMSNALIPMGLITELPGTNTPLLNLTVNFRTPEVDPSSIGGAIRIDTRGQNLGAPLFQWISREANSQIDNLVMSLTSSGNLGVGISNPTERLSINGKIRAKEIKVENSNWPDFVFDKSYALPTLKETESHIKVKGHLSGIPSAVEVKANGVDLGEMNAKLLQKIEELTLHLIEQNKRMKVQEEKNLKQQEDIDNLKKLVFQYVKVD